MEKVTFMDLESETWAVSYDWNALMTLMYQAVEYSDWSDEPIGYKGNYNFATIYRWQGQWIISEVIPFKEGGCIGLEEIRDNKVCLGRQAPSIKDIDQAITEIAARAAEYKRERQEKLETQLTNSPRDLYLDDIPF